MADRHEFLALIMTSDMHGADTQTDRLLDRQTDKEKARQRSVTYQ